MDADEEVDDFIMESEYFDFDQNWKPSITKEEVLKYSEENYWNI